MFPVSCPGYDFSPASEILVIILFLWCFHDHFNVTLEWLDQSTVANS